MQRAYQADMRMLLAAIGKPLTSRQVLTADDGITDPIRTIES